MVLASEASAQITTPGNYERLRQDTAQQVKGRLNTLLGRYCGEACQIIDVTVDIEETIGETEDLGFEAVAGEEDNFNLFVSRVGIDIQVDERVTVANRERLRQILSNHLRNLGYPTLIRFVPVTLPQIGQSANVAERLRQDLRARIERALQGIIERYCPETCLLGSVHVDGTLVSPDEAAGIPAAGQVIDPTGRSVLRIDSVDASVSIDQALPAADRLRVVDLMRARTRFATPVNLDINVFAFPESYATKQSRANAESADPFGLEKLRRMLEMFRDLAGTKEIITSNETRSETDATQTKDSTASTEGQIGWLWALILGVFLLAAVAGGVFLMRYRQAASEAQMMMAAPMRAGDGEPTPPDGQSEKAGDSPQDMTLKLRIDSLRQELVQTFVDQPKVAKDTFGRMLQEDGVETTGKYVSLFGQLIVFELLGDPNLQRDLQALSEYYHKSDFTFDLREELELLQKLKTRVVASEIRVLTSKTTEQFDFLLKLDASQIHSLIVDESPQVQSIVLTQLDHNRRMGVFEMFQGQHKVDLMRELCRADAIPKEYLQNVAVALQKKVNVRPEFDTANIRSSDILLDLLEKATLPEQRRLMANLADTNAEASRAIKMKLITMEILPYLKDGHLLEIILGMDRDDLLTFLLGAEDHIRDLILNKAPEELAQSWIEDLEQMAAADEQAFQLVQLKIKAKIRSLANSGGINLLDINEMIFALDAGLPEVAEESQIGAINPQAIVA